MGAKMLPMLLLVFIGCRDGSAKDKSDEKNTPKDTDSVVATENFITFFENFNKDSVFQLSRIQFPLKFKSNEGEKLTIQKREWSYTKLIEEKSTKTVIRKKVISNTEIRIDYMKEDTGILINHTFHLIGKQWILTNIEDHST